MSESDGALLASHVARLFFDRQMSKVEIATRLGISRFRVARLIDQARAGGLVRIEFRDVPAATRQLAQAIEECWGIDLCVVTTSAESGDALTAMARGAAAVVGDLVGPNQVIGVAWGSTLAAVVGEIPARADPSVVVVQLAGSSVRVERDRTPGELARRLADRLGGRYQALFAPAFVETPALRNALLREPEIQATIGLYDQVTLAIIGIGALAGEAMDVRSSLVQSGVLDETEWARLREQGAVGDLLLYPFDAEGRFVAPALCERAIAIGLDRLRRVRQVVAVAGGARKVKAIAGALATGIVRTLVTDEAAATGLATLAQQRARGQGGPGTPGFEHPMGAPGGHRTQSAERGDRWGG
jgi:DNA-binding transcriptional regulator LsrR (DeoR family)